MELFELEYEKIETDTLKRNRMKKEKENIDCNICGKLATVYYERTSKGVVCERCYMKMLDK